MNRRGADRTGPLGGTGTVGLWGASSFAWTVQVAGISANAATTNYTCNAVDIANSFVLPLGLSSTYASTNYGVAAFTAKLTTSTNVAVSRANWSGGETVFFAIVQFAPGIIKSLQTVESLLISATSVATAITSVNTNKVLVILQQRNNGDNLAGPNKAICSVQALSATTVTVGRDVADATYYPTASTTIVEFF